MIFLPVKWDEFGTKTMDFEKSHIDNKGFGGIACDINSHGFEPHLDHERRTKVFLFFI